MAYENLKAQIAEYNKLCDEKCAKTPERQNLKYNRVYTPVDIEGFDYERDLGMPGEFPYTRGVQPTMYRGRFWTMRMYAGFATAEESNKRYRYLIESGATGLSCAFDLPTQIGYDSDDVMAEGEVGKVGVAIDSLADMEILFDGIDLGKVSTSMTINAPASVLLAMYIAVAEKQGVPSTELKGTIQNDILKEYAARGTYIFPPKPSMRLITNIFEYCSQYVPKWNTISISGYHIREAGSTAAQEIAFTIADGIAYVEAALKAGLDVDTFAGRLSFFWNAHNNVLEEVAKFRASRRLWATIMKERFGAKKPKSMMLRVHTQTAGSMLTAQQVDNNIVRVALQTAAAVMGGTQSLHTNSRDEALALPTEASVQVALRTQQIVAYESGLADVVDPLGGSYYVEALTDELIRRAWGHIQEIESLGGMAKAIDTGLPKMRIEEAAARRQARIDSGREAIIGINKYRLDKEDPLDILDVDNTAVREAQIRRLEQLRANRDEEKVQSCLEAITKATESGEGNLLALALEAARARASLGEISFAVEKVCGRHKAVIRSISGVYSSEFEDDDVIKEVRQMADNFEELEGRRPRIMIAKMGQDGHDRGAKVIATSFADMGFDVDIGPLFQTPEETAQDAVDNDVHIVGFSSLAAGHKTLLPQLVEELNKRGRGDILVAIGGVIPAQDYEFLREHGAVAIFGPGTVLPVAAKKLLETLTSHVQDESHD